MMIRPRGFWRRVREFSRVFSFKDMALFKVSDLLTGLVETTRMRRIRALREFAYLVPPELVRVREGAYRFPYSIRGRDLVFSLRAGSSDVDAFLQVVRDEEYRDAVRMLSALGGVGRIIDAGANIGLTTLYLSCHFPAAKILSLEPELGNFRQLQRCAHENELEGITLLNLGIWTRDTCLVPDPGFRDGREWSFALRESSEPAATGISVRSLESILDKMGWDRVDLLKLDVEGSEAKLMRDEQFLTCVRNRVGLLCLEIHEEVISRTEVQDALASVGMQSVNSGETLLAWAWPRGT